MVMHHARTRSAKLLTGCERLAFGQVQPASVQPDVPERKYLDRKYSNRGHLIRGAAVSTVLTAALAFPSIYVYYLLYVHAYVMMHAVCLQLAEHELKHELCFSWLDWISMYCMYTD